MGLQAKPVLLAQADLGESPYWDARLRRLVWADILRREVHYFDPETGEDVTHELPQQVGAVRARAGGGHVLNLADGVAVVDSDWSALEFRSWRPRPGVRGNDAAVDAAGRLWAGTMREDEAPNGGDLRVVTGDGAERVVVSPVTVSNGIDWSPDGTLMYYVDSPTRQIDVFRFDVDSGEIADRRPWARLSESDGFPDGITVDASGDVWVACYGGGAVRRYSGDGRLVDTIEVPTPYTTACAFGGEGLHDLYVTTAARDFRLAGEEVNHPAGALFIVPEAGTGRPGHEFNG